MYFVTQTQFGFENDYRNLRANFTYDVIPIALFQAPIYVTSANEVLM